MCRVTRGNLSIFMLLTTHRDRRKESDTEYSPILFRMWIFLQSCWSPTLVMLVSVMSTCLTVLQMGWSTCFTSTNTAAPLLESLGLFFRQFWKLDLNDLQVEKPTQPAPSMSGVEKSWTVILASCGMILTFSSFSSISSLLSASSAQFSSWPVAIPKRSKTDYCYFLWVTWKITPTQDGHLATQGLHSDVCHLE